MSVTLDEMIQYTARQTKRTEDVVKTGTVYMDDALDIVNLYIDGFNYAKNKICRERWKPRLTERFVVGQPMALTKDLHKIKEIRVVDTDTLMEDWTVGPGLSINIPDMYMGMTVDIEYFYVIPDFPNNPTATDLQINFPFPEGIVDYRILCFYACYEYLLVRGSDRDLDKSNFFLNKFNDGFYHIPKDLGALKVVQDRARY